MYETFQTYEGYLIKIDALFGRWHVFTQDGEHLLNTLRYKDCITFIDEIV